MAAFCLVLGPRERQEIERVRGHAENPVHFWRGDAAIPGAEFRCDLGLHEFMLIRVIYTISIGEMEDDDRPLCVCVRHLTLRFLNQGLAVVVPFALVEEVARLFGFTGGVEDWRLEPYPLAPTTLVVFQPHRCSRCGVLISAEPGTTWLQTGHSICSDCAEQSAPPEETDSK